MRSSERERVERKHAVVRERGAIKWGWLVDVGLPDGWRLKEPRREYVVRSGPGTGWYVEVEVRP